MEAYRIVAFGDSITFGGPLPPAQRWVHLLEERLQSDGLAVVVRNAGVGGHTTAQGLARIERDVFGRRPDLVLIQFGFNDCHVVAGAAPRVAPEQFRHNLRTIGRRVREEAGAEIVYLVNHPTLIFRVQPDGRPYERSSRHYNQIIREVAAELKAPWVDLHRSFGRHGVPLGQLLTEDQIHLSTAGHREYAQIVGDFLVEALRGVAPRVDELQEG